MFGFFGVAHVGHVLFPLPLFGRNNYARQTQSVKIMMSGKSVFHLSRGVNEFVLSQRAHFAECCAFRFSVHRHWDEGIIARRCQIGLFLWSSIPLYVHLPIAVQTSW